jgi:cation diffusion facilitator CzcD-associated flavoprotein CzcO
MGSLDRIDQSLQSISDVAVIGAGISGITSAAHLLRQGIKPTVFERSSQVGGVWHYDDRVANEPDYPNIRAPQPTQGHLITSQAKTSTVKSKSFEAVSVEHAPPGPCYKGLRNNVPTTLMRSTLLNWPEGTPDFVSQDRIDQYIRDLSIYSGANEHVLFDTSVDSITKNIKSGKWVVRTRTLRKTGSDYEFLGRRWEFDAVIVASGHYHEPKIPDLPGLKEWKERHPESISHSKRYRSPEPFKDKTVFVIGAGVSSLDIVRESNAVAKKVYQSSRDGQFDIPASLLPPEAERVGGIEKFVPYEDSAAGDVVLQDGTVLTGVDAIVLGTGYITSYPFLGPLQDPSAPTEEADNNIVVSKDGLTTHNLHKDIFYIPDPTLIFVGVPYYTSTFSLFDFQAEVVSRFLAGKAALPNQEILRQEYDERKAGLVEGNKTFHSLMRKEVPYMNGILEWVNAEAQRLGHEPMRGVDDRWLERYEFFMAEMKKRRETDPAEDQGKPLIPEGLRLTVAVAGA